MNPVMKPILAHIGVQIVQGVKGVTCRVSLREFLMSITWPPFMKTFGNLFRNWSVLALLAGVRWKERERKWRFGFKGWCDVCKISSLSLTRKCKPGDELLVSSILNLLKTGMKLQNCTFRYIFFPHKVLKPQKECRLEICFGVQKENSHPSGLVRTAANEKNKGLKQQCGVAAWLSLHHAHLRAVLLVRSERAVKHDDPVSVEAQPDRLLWNQLGPCGCQLHKTLSFASKDIQFPYPVQHQVKVHTKVGSRRVCAGVTPAVSVFWHRVAQFVKKLQNAADRSHCQSSQPPRCPPPRLNRTLLESSETQRLDITINHLQHKPLN